MMLIGNKLAVSRSYATSHKIKIVFNPGKSSILMSSQGNLDLLEAAKKGNVTAVSRLLKRSDINKNYYNSMGNSAICLAALHGHLAVVNTLVQARVNVNSPDMSGCAPLHRAAQKGHLEIVNALLQAGAEVNVIVWDKTALHMAAEKNHVKIVNALLQARADVNIWRTGDRTILLIAASLGHREVVTTLLQAGAEVNRRSTWDDVTALHQAAHNGHLEVVNALLQAGADVHLQDKHKWTALHKAAATSHLKVVNVLLQVGATVNQQTMEKETALHMAAEKGHLEIVNMLLHAGADVNLQNENEWTALHKAVDKGHLEIVNALLQAGAAVNLTNWFGKTALDLAKTVEIRKLLRQYGGGIMGRIYVGIMGKPARKAVASPSPPPLEMTSAPSPATPAGDPNYFGKPTAIPSGATFPARTPAAQATTGTTTTTQAPRTLKTDDPITRLSAKATTATTIKTTSTPAASNIADPITPPTKITAAIRSTSALEKEAKLVLAQAVGVQARREWMQRRDALQAQYDAAEKANAKFSEIARLGKALAAADAESGSLTLSVEDYGTLYDRHKQLVARLEAECFSKKKDKDYDALECLSQLLESLRVLNASELVYPTATTAKIVVYITDGREEGAKAVVIDNKD